MVGGGKWVGWDVGERLEKWEVGRDWKVQSGGNGVGKEVAL